MIKNKGEGDYDDSGKMCRALAPRYFTPQKV